MNIKMCDLYNECYYSKKKSQKFLPLIPYSDDDFMDLPGFE